RGSNSLAGNASTVQHLTGCTLAAYAEAKRLPIEFLGSLGLIDACIGVPNIRIPYFDTTGAERAVRFRIALDGRDKFRWRKGSKAIPYGLERLREAEKTGEITITEGESDCHTLWYAGLPAIGLPGADTWNEERDAGMFDNFPCIYVVIE